MADLSKLPAPPKGQTGVTLQSLSHLPSPPQGQKGMTLDQVSAASKPPALPGEGAVNMIKGGLKTAANFLSSSEQAAGKDIAGAIVGNNAPGTDTRSKLVGDLIAKSRELKASGQDSSKIDAEIQRQSQYNAPGLKDTNPVTQKSPLEVGSDFAGVAADVLTAGTYGKAAKGLESGTLALKAADPTMVAGVKGTVKAASDAYAKKAEQSALKSTAKLVAGTDTKVEALRAIKSVGAVPKTWLNPAKVALTKSKTQAIQAVHPLLKGIKTAAEGVNIVRDGIGHEAEALKTAIASVDRPYVFKELNSTLKKVELPGLLKNDATLRKTYDGIVDKVMGMAKNMDGKISNVLELRKQFDAEVEHQFGDLYSNDRLTPVRAAVRSTRNALNDFIEAHLPDDIKFKDSLHKQSSMYDALDGLAEKALEEIKAGKSKGGSLLSTAGKIGGAAAATYGLIEGAKKLGI
jgi:hypothetical protein